mgnify:CR=1 FL=1
MKVSLNWVKKYIDIPAELTNSQIAYDLTMRTVEVEDVVDTAEKFHDIVVGKITAVNAHPNADKLRVCMVDIGESEVQICMRVKRLLYLSPVLRFTGMVKVSS